jgi:hypothetical protein
MNGSHYVMIIAMADSTEELTSAKFCSTVLSLGIPGLSIPIPFPFPNIRSQPYPKPEPPPTDRTGQVVGIQVKRS